MSAELVLEGCLLALTPTTRGLPVHLLSPSPDSVTAVKDAASGRGMAVFDVDVSGVEDPKDIIGAVGREMLFPYRVTGHDAVVDLLSDLDWLAHDGGYFVLLRATSESAPYAKHAIADFARVFPALSRRWDEVDTPFHAAISADDELLRHVVGVLSEAEEKVWAQMRLSSDREPPIRICDHRRLPGSSSTRALSRCDRDPS